MMMKKICMIALFAMLVIASTTAAWAQFPITATISQTGTLDGVGSWVAVTAQGVFSDTRAFVLPTNSANQLLAVALSAQASSKNITLFVNSLEAWSTCSGIFMVN